MTRKSSQVSPHHSTGADVPRPLSRSSLQKKAKSSLSPLKNRLTLNVEKFDQVLSPNFTSGFEESDECFCEVTQKASALIGAEKCFLFIRDTKEQKLYSYVKDSEGKPVRLTKPIDRGITGSILSESSGYFTSKVFQSNVWSHELDELPDYVTLCYLAWPIWDFAACKSIGVVEFRNKINGVFSNADLQLARIIALQLGHAVINYKQQELIAGHTEAISQAYEKNFEQEEEINLPSQNENLRTAAGASGGGGRGAFSLTKQPSLFTTRRSSVAVNDRAWDFDVFQKSEEELLMHAIDIFDERGLFSRFSIPVSTFVNFVNAVKDGYAEQAPYHNSYHAYDVMHVCYLLMTKCRADEYLESFNVLSILVAALAHDLGHDGFNNAFHANSGSDLAVTYNGISILENYSAAYLFRILRKKDCNIFLRLNDEEMYKMRTRLIDMILDTDAKNHFMLMTRFKHGLEMKKLSRGLLSSMILHVSDVSNPTRPGPIARQWAYSVQREFFRQGDREKQLGIAHSPFMDRDYENLPRMQIAFIDAVVQPVFQLLADFLPSVEDHCIKPLQLNRAFWHSMCQRGANKTDDIKFFLASQTSNDLVPSPPPVNTLADGRRESESSVDSFGDEEPIPGIPSNADKDNTPNIRRASVISLNLEGRRDSVDPELGLRFEKGEEKRLSTRRLSLPMQMKKSSQTASRVVLSGMKGLLSSRLFQALTLACTIYSLFAFDLNIAVGTMNGDTIVDYVTFGVLVVFVIELCLSLACVDGYFHFFLWLDIAATISLWFEISFLLELTSGPDMGTDFALAKAGRAAKAGARAGRLASILRMIRLVKIFRVAKWTLGRVMRRARTNENTKGDELDDDLHFSMSVIGRRMTESITKKVIIAVVLMLILFSATETNYTPDARQLTLDSIAKFPDSLALRDSYFQSHENIVSFIGHGYEFSDQLRLEGLRAVEVLTLFADTNDSVSAQFDISSDVHQEAWTSLLITFFVSILLATMGLLFSRDAYKMVIHPIEKMKSTIQSLSENPLLHLERIRSRGSSRSESNETDMLQQAITKMASLLQVGFGSAGAEIIAKNLSDMGDLNPMVPGIRVNAIFGFCDIRDFTFATEGLQQDVMLFVNKIAEITHRHVVDSGGHPNKNIGDAFLLVWKLKSGKNTNSSGDLQKELFDNSLTCMQRVIRDINRAGNLSSFLSSGKMNAAWASSLSTYKVAMGVGLHKGWAIEGAIGSSVKIDASYLSPNVNLASRLESATKQYAVPLLMSQQFFGGLSGSIQSTCRRCDKVIFKGSTDPIVIYAQDLEPLTAYQQKQTPAITNNLAELLRLTTCDETVQDKYRGLLADAQAKLDSTSELAHREVYDFLFNSYLDRAWTRCRLLCHIWLKSFPADAIVHCLVKHLAVHDFDCPADWPGAHRLTDK